MVFMYGSSAGHELDNPLIYFFFLQNPKLPCLFYKEKVLGIDFILYVSISLSLFIYLSYILETLPKSIFVMEK